MTIFDRFNIKVVASAGLCGAAIALSPVAAAVPLITGGYGCIQGAAANAAPLAAAPPELHPAAWDSTTASAANGGG